MTKVRDARRDHRTAHCRSDSEVTSRRRPGAVERAGPCGRRSLNRPRPICRWDHRLLGSTPMPPDRRTKMLLLRSTSSAAAGEVESVFWAPLLPRREDRLVASLVPVQHRSLTVTVPPVLGHGCPRVYSAPTVPMLGWPSDDPDRRHHPYRSQGGVALRIRAPYRVSRPSLSAASDSGIARQASSVVRPEASISSPSAPVARRIRSSPWRRASSNSQPMGRMAMAAMFRARCGRLRPWTCRSSCDRSERR